MNHSVVEEAIASYVQKEKWKTYYEQAPAGAKRFIEHSFVFAYCELNGIAMPKEWEESESEMIKAMTDEDWAYVQEQSLSRVLNKE